MKKATITVEDIERKQRLLSLLFKVFVAILILIVCIFAGWLISFIGYAEELIPTSHLHTIIPEYWATLPNILT